MKKIISMILAVLMLIGLCACGGTDPGTDETDGGKASDPVKEGVDAEGLQVGFGRESMMPRGNCWLGGNGEGRVSEGFSDISYVTCVAITEGEETILLYTADIISPGDWLGNIEKSITEATGVSAERILFAATHTHAGVGINYTWDGVEDYRVEFAKAAAKAGETAMADRSAAQLWSGSTETEKMTFVRHYINEDGSYFGSNFGTDSSKIAGHAYEADTELQVVKFARAAEDKKDIVLMSFPTHATMTSGDNVLSADFPAPCREYIEANSDTLVAYFMGTAGDQVPSSRIAGEVFSSDYKVYGEKLGQYVLDTLPKLIQTQGSGIKFQSATYTFNTNKEGIEKLPQAQEVVRAADANGRSHPTTQALIQEYGFASFWEAKYLISHSKMGDTKDKTIYTMEIGGISMIIAPYEMFSAHGRYVKENSPYDMTFIITCCEDSGYIPTEEAFGYHSYEAQVTSYAKGTGEALAENFVQLLTQMKGE